TDHLPQDRLPNDRSAEPRLAEDRLTESLTGTSRMMTSRSLPSALLSGAFRARSLASLFALLACLFGAFATSSCAVKRTLTIDSEPPGATVRLDDELLVDENGEALRTPIKLSFQHYGVRRLALYLDGYRTASKRIRLRAPWYLRFPIDLFTEVLLPLGWTDRRSITFQLDIEEGRVDDELFLDVLNRAETLRRAGPSGPRARENTPLPLDRLEDEETAGDEDSSVDEPSAGPRGEE
ncbi:MAG: PEGA domain-containing protein, partial [Planctomycetota bacterium]